MRHSPITHLMYVVAVDTGEPAMNLSLTFQLSIVNINDPPSMPTPTLLPSVTSWNLDLNVGVGRCNFES